MISYWKSFKIGDLFKRYSTDIGTPVKNILVSDVPDNEFKILLISESKNNNGLGGYVKNDIKFKENIRVDRLTMSDQFARCFYQKDKYITCTSHLNTIEFNFEKLWEKISISCKRFFAEYLTRIYQPTHNYTRKVCAGNDFDREIILLPVKQCAEQDAIWHEEDRTPLTLDTETIERIMNRIEERKKEKTINAYVASKAKYELEKAKYAKDPAFLEKYGKMFWKSFKVGDLFERSNDHQIKASIKDLITSDVKTKEFCVANITSSSVNNGIACWLKDEGEVTSKKKKGFISVAPNGYAGTCFYQDEYFISTGNSNYLKLKSICISDTNAYLYISTLLTCVLRNKFHGFQRPISCGNDFDREIILLPVIKNDNNEDEIFTDAMSYLYLSSMVLKYQKKIDDYNNKINMLKGETNVQE